MTKITMRTPRTSVARSYHEAPIRGAHDSPIRATEKILFSQLFVSRRESSGDLCVLPVLEVTAKTRHRFQCLSLHESVANHEWNRTAKFGLGQIYSIKLNGPGGPEAHHVIGILSAEGELMGGERIWASEACLRAMVGPLFDERERIGDDRPISIDEHPKTNIIHKS